MDPPDLETDPRFPSGRWVGFFLDRRIAGKHQMELVLTFSHATLKGEGRDFVGAFSITGRYDTADGKCHFHKRYAGRHDVYYQGFAEEKGIWGTWELVPSEVYGFIKGGFYIWPEGMEDPTQRTLKEEAPAPRELVEV